MGAADTVREGLREGRKVHQNSRSGLGRLFYEAFGPDRKDMWGGIAVVAAALTYGEGVKFTWTFDQIPGFIEGLVGDIF